MSTIDCQPQLKGQARQQPVIPAGGLHSNAAARRQRLEPDEQRIALVDQRARSKSLFLARDHDFIFGDVGTNVQHIWNAGVHHAALLALDLNLPGWPHTQRKLAIKSAVSSLREPLPLDSSSTLGSVSGEFLLQSVPVRRADLPQSPLSDTTATSEHFPGKFIWADLFTPDPATAQAFYTGLFGWEATTIEHTTPSGTTHSYIVMANGGDPIAGLARLSSRMQDAVHGRWVGYVSVPDVAKALAAATAAGGRVLFPAKDLPRRGAQAIFVDPESAELGVLHSSSGDPGEYTPDHGDWTWAQLFARDPAAEGRFYASVAGWEVLPDTRGDRPNVFVLARGGYSRASMAPLPARPNATPAWLLFVRVADVKAAAAKAISLGGRVLVAPSDTPTEYWRAVIADPTGAVIGLVQLQEPGQSKEQP